MSSNLFKVSQSKVKTWRKCRRAYHYRYVEELRRKRVSRPLQFGKIVHRMLEAYANGDDPFEVLDTINLKDQELFAAEREAYGDIIEDIRCIMTEYFLYHDENSLVYQRRNGKASEHKFEIEILPGVIWNGFIDAEAKTPNSLRWVVEHKTFTNLPNEDHRWRNLQSATYIRAIDVMGWRPVDGVCWDYIRSKPPSRPQVLKNGELSKRGIDSLPTRVIEVLEELGKDPAEFKPLLQSVANNRKHYFPRIFNPVKSELVDLLFKDFVETIQEMVELHGRTKSRNIDRHCDWCEYEGLCRAALQGLDVDFVKEREYYVHSKDDEAEPTDPAE